ncbi:uncharacterized protein LOC114579626 [Dendrobium catenatum]|uniref:uncharacterized protein LOC114579626 n=1 Tax=Dendrobium catenatum TaxID=906689 RepID=UPI0010A06387|nr:uncharacterized protein LOC114579626 [Dendrobium catenatum]
MDCSVPCYCDFGRFRESIAGFSFLAVLMFGQQLPYSSYFFLFTSDKITCENEKYCGPLYWKSWLREHLLTIEREKATFPQSSYSHYEGVNILLGSIAYSLVIFPAFDNSEVDPLVAFGIQNPKQGMKIFQAALFYINNLLKFESNSSKILHHSC